MSEILQERVARLRAQTPGARRALQELAQAKLSAPELVAFAKARAAWDARLEEARASEEKWERANALVESAASKWQSDEVLIDLAQKATKARDEWHAAQSRVDEAQWAMDLALVTALDEGDL